MIMKNLILLTFAAVLLSCSNNEKPTEKKSEFEGFLLDFRKMGK